MHCNLRLTFICRPCRRARAFCHSRIISSLEKKTKSWQFLFYKEKLRQPAVIIASELGLPRDLRGSRSHNDLLKVPQFAMTLRDLLLKQALKGDLFKELIKCNVIKKKKILNQWIYCISKLVLSDCRVRNNSITSNRRNVPYEKNI